MPEESSTPPPYDPKRRVGTGLAGETTRGQDSAILPDAQQRPLDVIGDFEVLGKLGQGGMGTVYRARQVSLDRQVALKILPSALEVDPEYVTRFQREARVAASLSHANLVKVYSSGLADGCHYIAMELIEGETLAQWVKRGVLPPLEALRIILDVVRALECGWRTAQLIHRDIKPGNIFLSVEGDVKLGDLGLAKIIGGESTTGLTQTGAAMGTPHYISPEQARGDKDLDFRADIYSLGCTLYQMLTGLTPYSGSEPLVVMSQHLNAPPPAILKVMPHCPLPLGRLVSKMMKKQRRERYSSYEELITAIEIVRAQLDPTLLAPTIPAALQHHAPDAMTPSPTPAGKTRRAGPDQGTAGGRPQPAKSRLPLYGGIAAGFVALSIVAWLAWPKEEKLTAAQRWAHDHAGEKKAEAESGASPASEDARPVTSDGAGRISSPSTADGTRPVLSTGTPDTGWQPLVSATEWQATGEKGRQFKDGWLHLQAGLGHPGSSPDGTIRARIQFRNDTTGPDVIVRNVEGTGEYVLGLWTNAKGVDLSYRLGTQYVQLASYILPQPLQPGDVLVLELRAQGDLLVGLINGAAVLEAHDSRVTAAGKWGISAVDGWFESAEIQPFPTSVSTALEPAAITLWDTSAITPTAKGIAWEDGLLRLDGATLQSEPRSRDGILRASIRANSDAKGPVIALRKADQRIDGHIAQYRLCLESGHRVLTLRSNESGPLLGTWPLPRDYTGDEWIRLELRVIGDVITVSVDDRVVGTVRDDSVRQPGLAMIYAGAAGYFRDIVYVPLDKEPSP